MLILRYIQLQIMHYINNIRSLYIEFPLYKQAYNTECIVGIVLIGH